MDWASVWKVHCASGWPADLGSHEAEVMTLDTVIGGCVREYLTEQKIDSWRAEILRDCLNELEEILPELEGEAHSYCDRLRTLAQFLLNCDSA